MTVAGDLSLLEQRLRRDLELLELPARSWVPARRHDGSPVRDVVVVGAGMCGLVALAQLKLLGIDNAVAFDAREAGREGPWVTFARMLTLRSPKQLAGPALGQPSLTFRAWHEARFGAEAWRSLDKIPREMWMDYLVWYRAVLELPVENGVRVLKIETASDGVMAVRINRNGHGGTETVFARRVVLATGRDGLGKAFVPAVAQGITPRFRVHSSDDIDFERLRGRRIGVVGAGASAMDNAATALEAGAASVDLFIRRKDLPRINKLTGVSSPGMVHGFAGLPDDWKWRFLHYANEAQTPPPRDSTLRVSRWPNARFHLASPVVAMREIGDEIELETPFRTCRLDFVIFATGFDVSIDTRPELAAFAGNIARWADRLTPPDALADRELASYPYLGPSFEFQEKEPGLTPGLTRIHAFNYPATLSHGKLSGDIPAVSEGAGRLGRAIARSLFVEDRQRHFETLTAYDTAELVGDEWTDFETHAESGKEAE